MKDLANSGTAASAGANADGGAISENARMVAHSAFEFAEGSGGLARARAIRDRSPHLDLSTWQQITRLGWPLVNVAERHGGLDFGTDAIAALAESTARMLLPEPLIAQIAAAGVLSGCGTSEALAALAQLVEGKQLFVAACSAAAPGDPLRLMYVPDCYDGVGLLAGRRSAAGYEIRMLSSDADGVTRQTSECIDGSILSNLEITEDAWKRSLPVGEGQSALRAMDNARDTMLLGYAASLVGIMDEALQMSVEYLKVRSQFGVPIGSFQALQHRAASCHVDLLSSRALVYEACKAFGTPMQARAAAAAKARASGAALRVTKECVQFHGAIGFADEHNVGLYFKRAVTLAARMGNERQQWQRYAASAT